MMARYPFFFSLGWVQNFRLPATLESCFRVSKASCHTLGTVTNTSQNCSTKLPYDKKSTGESRGRQGSSSRNYDVIGRDMPYLFVKSSNAHKIRRTGARSSGLFKNKNGIRKGGTHSGKKNNCLQGKWKKLLPRFPKLFCRDSGYMTWGFQ